MKLLPRKIHLPIFSATPPCQGDWLTHCRTTPNAAKITSGKLALAELWPDASWGVTAQVPSASQPQISGNSSKFSGSLTYSSNNFWEGLCHNFPYSLAVSKPVLCRLEHRAVEWHRYN